MFGGQLDGFFAPMHQIVAPINGIGGLYLGNIRAASDHDILFQKGIGCVVTVVLTKLVLPVNFSHLIIPADDIESQDLRQYFEQTNQFIAANLQKTNVLVHCMAGVSRSTTIVIAYLMSINHTTFQETLQFVRNIRVIVGPNDGFVEQLEKYEQELKIAKLQN